jgi:hypothetical protein
MRFCRGISSRAWRGQGSRDDRLLWHSWGIQVLSKKFISCSWPVQLSVFRLGLGSRTLRRNPQSMRRISIASAASGLQLDPESRSESVASWNWYSSSQVDLMLISKKRANSFEPDAPHPSTMLKAIDSAADIIWVLREPVSPRGNDRAIRRTLNTSSCALRHTLSFLKSCTPERSDFLDNPRPQSNAALVKSFPKKLPSKGALALSTLTDTLATQDLDPLTRTSNSPNSPV